VRRSACSPTSPSERELADAVRATRDSFGGVDILVNNAGIFANLVPGPFDQLEADDWRKVLEVNVIGSFLAAKAVVGPMRERGGGQIVNIASTTALKGTAYLLHYTSSKGAILAMTKGLARELGGDGIRVNAVAPGFTVSEGVEQNAEHVGAMRSSAPGSRIPAPRDGAGRHRRGGPLPRGAPLRLHDRADDRRRRRGLPALTWADGKPAT